MKGSSRDQSYPSDHPPYETEIILSPSLKDLLQSIPPKSDDQLLKLIIASKTAEDCRKAEEARLRYRALEVSETVDVTCVGVDSNQLLYRKRSISSLSSHSDAADDISRLSLAQGMIIVGEHHQHPATSQISDAAAESLSSFNSSVRDPLPRHESHVMEPRTTSSYIRVHSRRASDFHVTLPPLLSPHQSHHSLPTPRESQSPPNQPIHTWTQLPKATIRDRRHTITSPYISPARSPTNATAPIGGNSETEIPSQQKPKRQRNRTIQPVTTIIETRDPNNTDNFIWKNNGNTVQRKTGCRSVYYKCCFAGTTGCCVNKTVTSRPNGTYLVKYRGEHLPTCGQVTKISYV
ncbi:hypothetical protein BZG36_00271 [Bifiguratus adelaidae]|uniref:WRKY domain-containing protein n=1 Tax=Bifiguratus adelaidae TaxID=1938954 RepID=A0A261Y7T9_9FUNG|nr:hypothetical protein BZG36_00271 [Bifiguratus adelaidae]